MLPDRLTLPQELVDKSILRTECYNSFHLCMGHRWCRQSALPRIRILQWP
jgi:hypothetical protein